MMVLNILGMVREMKSRSPAVLKVSALTGEGLEKLDASIEAVRSKFERGDFGLRLRSASGMIAETAKGILSERLGRVVQEKTERLARLVVEGRLTVDDAADRLTC